MPFETLFHFGFLMILFAHFGFSSPSIYTRTITVDMSGQLGDFRTIQGAVDSVPSGNDQWIRIYVSPGVYMEKVTIPRDKQYILLEGSSSSQTIITDGDHLKTDSSATFTAWPDNFVAKGITFKNSYNRAVLVRPNYVNNRVPAVAARIYGDKSSFHQCGFVGFQDTLFDVQGRHYFNSCYIEGAVDFIWGSGQSLFEECLINVTAGLPPYFVSAGYITAQGRQSAVDPSGFVFKRCIVTGSGQAYLGRAYRPFSRVIFFQTILGAVVVPAGWDSWHYTHQEGNFTYAEVNCQGPGADTSRRVGWVRKVLSPSELLDFSSRRFVDQDGWLALQP